ncbi:polysaccharide biosynthesis tyrosine autokinase [Cohnella sp. CFH 77786]|uniref:CpsD/CapB family tyrosine-protein kinase n=1 Tax=Cohnella sp. CFH 77786 TaxID=2662265 RepID=UPI001C60BE2A|nr:CpsD/CapB family tyrosine-protein kinase [Cohnella sp. CFH 77786]MBW5448349.1 polysaccharide biosynthesis tyrosine autokinase [Cohnella sp. CFH 77786]
MSRQTIKPKLVAQFNPSSPVSETYRTLRTNVQFAAIDQPIRTLAVSSTHSGDGRTTTAANLAVSFAQEGKKTLLIDGDLRKPSLHQMFMIPNRSGLSDALIGERPSLSYVQETSTPGLNVMTTGTLPANPADVLSSRKMRSMLDEFKQHFDVILFDTPPVLAVADGLIVASFCDGVILVLNEGKTKHASAQKAMQYFGHAKARVLGVVLNNLKRKRS